MPDLETDLMRAFDKGIKEVVDTTAEMLEKRAQSLSKFKEMLEGLNSLNQPESLRVMRKAHTDTLEDEIKWLEGFASELRTATR